MASDIYLLSPGIFGPTMPAGVAPDAYAQTLTAGLSLSALESRLARARRTHAPLPGPGLDALLHGLFGGNAVGPDGDFPTAALRYRADTGRTPPGWILCADPVHLHPDLGELNLFAADSFSLAQDESDAMISSLNSLLAGEDLRFEATTPGHWYIHTTSEPQIKTRAATDIVGSIANALPSGPRAAWWHGIMNEAQMLLHSHVVNERREMRGEVSVNSIWLWGVGITPAPANPLGFCEVWSTEPLASALAVANALTWRGLPESAHEVLTSGELSGTRLVVYGDCYRPSLTTDVDAWRDAVTRFEQDWFTPLCAALGSRLQILRLRGDAHKEFVLDRRSKHRFWRRSLGLTHYQSV